LLKISPKQELVDSIYIAALLENEATQRKLKSMSHGGTMGILNAGLLKQLIIPLPPLNIQQKFATIAESIEQQKTRLRAHLTELDTLFASLQQRAFNGDL
jgi:type I restriction enzyme S subunit